MNIKELCHSIFSGSSFCKQVTILKIQNDSIDAELDAKYIISFHKAVNINYERPCPGGLRNQIIVDFPIYSKTDYLSSSKRLGITESILGEL